jgi:SulP family sulfate permease
VTTSNTVPSKQERWLSAVQTALHPERLIPALFAGLIIALLQIAIATSFGALIFNGELSSSVAVGIGLGLFATTVSTIFISLFSSFPVSISASQDAPAAILAVVAAAIVSAMPVGSSAEQTALTVVAAIALTALLSGAFLFGLGIFKMARLVRFLPYPVVGGFLAGTGWLIALGAISMMAGIPVSLSQLAVLLQAETLSRWLFGLMLAVLMLILSNRIRHYLFMPGMVLGAAVLFHVVAWLSGASPAALEAQGWLLGPFPAGGIWQPLRPSDLSQVAWPAVWGQVANILTILPLVAVALLLNASGLELVTRRDGDLNQEMRAAGLSNLVAGLGGGLVSYQSLSLSALNTRLDGNRLAGLFAAVICGVVLWRGGDVLSLIPRLVVGGLLLYLGLSFLVEWVITAWSRFPKIDYAILLLILVVIATVGFLQGVVVGLVAAVIMFVVNYSGTDVVKFSISGANYRSHVTRSLSQREILEVVGDQISILRLQGFLFFGTAHSLLDRMRHQLLQPDRPPVRYLLLDFMGVTGLDSTAMLSFAKLKQIAQTHDMVVLVANPAPTVRQQLSAGDFISGATVRHFADLDHALEWCEDQLLQEAGNAQEEFRPIGQQLAGLLEEPAAVDALLPYLEREEMAPGSFLMRQGDPPDALYFIESGQVTARVERPDGVYLRLETMAGGRVVGELGFYLGSTRTADVVVDVPSVIYRLSRQSLQVMEQQNPEAASTLHHLITRLLAERVTHLIRIVEAIQH